MITSRNFLVHYVPFTNAMFVRRVLSAVADETWNLRVYPLNPDYWSELTVQGTDKARLVTVRNPFECYVVWFAAHKNGSRRDGIYDMVSKNGRPIVSNYKLHLRNTNAQPELTGWQDFSMQQIEYWHKFIKKKWCSNRDSGTPECALLQL